MIAAIRVTVAVVSAAPRWCSHPTPDAGEVSKAGRGAGIVPTWGQRPRGRGITGGDAHWGGSLTRRSRRPPAGGHAGYDRGDQSDGSGGVRGGDSRRMRERHPGRTRARSSTRRSRRSPAGGRTSYDRGDQSDGSGGVRGAAVVTLAGCGNGILGEPGRGPRRGARGDLSVSADNGHKGEPPPAEPLIGEGGRASVGSRGVSAASRRGPFSGPEPRAAARRCCPR